MRAKLALSTVLLGLAVALAPQAATAAVPRQAPFPQAAGEPTCPGNGGWASLPNGMIFALAEDVCAPGGPVIDGQATCGTGSPSAGKVMLRPGKRRARWCCASIRGNAWRSPSPTCSIPTPQNVTAPPGNTQNQPSTRAASVHVQGMEWVKDANDDGSSWVGANSSSLVSPGRAAAHLHPLRGARGQLPPL